jgi:hypothetical protein
MNPRTEDAKESQTLYVLNNRYRDALSRIIADFSLDVIKEFIATVEQLEQDYRRASVMLDPLAYQPGRNGAK